MHAGSHGRALCVIRIYTSFTYLTYLCHSADVLSVYGLAVPLSLSLSLATLFWIFNPFFLSSIFYLVFSIFFFLLLSLFFCKVDGWLDFLADVGWHTGRRILETIGIFLQSCKTRSIFDRRESREVANNRGDFRSQIPLCSRGASTERIGRGAIN